jgi:hypothetical protein
MIAAVERSRRAGNRAEAVARQEAAMPEQRGFGSMTDPTHEDALVLIQLARWSTELDITQSLGFLRGGHFDDWQGFKSRHGPGTEGYEHLVRISQFFETVSTLWKHGLINETLLFDWLDISSTWELVKPLALGDRADRGVPGLWENFEALADAQQAALGGDQSSARRGVAVTTG